MASLGAAGMHSGGASGPVPVTAPSRGANGLLLIPVQRVGVDGQQRRSGPVVAVCALLGVAAIWGATYVVVKDAVAAMPVSDFLTWRFALASAVVAAVRPRALFRLSARGVRAGILLGLALAAAYLLQTVGLRSTPASVSGFITGLLVVLTPLGAALLYRERVPRACWTAVGLATAGLALLSLRGLSIGPGEVLTLGCAVAFALHILGLSRWAGRHDLDGLAVVQLMTVTVTVAVITLPDGLAVPSDRSVWAAVLVTAVLATALAYFLQTWVQSRLSATCVAVVLTTEPVFAGLVAVGFGGEQLSEQAALGALLVLVGMLLAARRPSTSCEPYSAQAGASEVPALRRSALMRGRSSAGSAAWRVRSATSRPREPLTLQSSRV